MKTIVILFSLLILVTSNAFSFDNEPDGFRGIKWGTKASDVPGLIGKQGSVTAGVTTYFFEKKNEDYDLGMTTFYKIYYIFDENEKFIEARCNYRSSYDYNRIYSILSAKYGKPDDSTTSESGSKDLITTTWNGKNVMVFLDKRGNVGSLRIKTKDSAQVKGL